MWPTLTDINCREFLILGVLAIAVLAMGLWRYPLLDRCHARLSVEHLAPAGCPVGKL